MIVSRCPGSLDLVHSMESLVLRQVWYDRGEEIRSEGNGNTTSSRVFAASVLACYRHMPSAQLSGVSNRIVMHYACSITPRALVRTD